MDESLTGEKWRTSMDKKYEIEPELYEAKYSNLVGLDRSLNNS